MIVWLEIETCVIGKGGAKRGVWNRELEEEVWGLLGFGTLVCVWVYFRCCSGGCLCNGLQVPGVCTVG
jgi:hypothetical protein